MEKRKGGLGLLNIFPKQVAIRRHYCYIKPVHVSVSITVYCDNFKGICHDDYNQHKDSGLKAWMKDSTFKAKDRMKGYLLCINPAVTFYRQ